MNKRIFTSESVTEGHPDKVSDKIADSILDALLEQDAKSRVACEVACTTGLVLVMGEITSNAIIDVQSIARKVICEIGYDKTEYGFDGKSVGIITAIGKQSGDIAMGVDNSFEKKKSGGDTFDQIGAGDQGMVFGYATDESQALMPMPIYLAHKLTAKLSEVRKTNVLPYLRPDGKAQVTVEYIDDVPVRVNTVVLSTQHNEDIDIEVLRADILREVIKKAIPNELLDANTLYYINPTGRFVLGGPSGDSGVTGRKIIVDSYGGYCPHGGGAFSGKDSTKVDRSACYMARYICKNIVASGLAKRCQIDIAYAIGVARPVSVQVNTFGSGIIDDVVIAKIIDKVFDLRPSAIIEQLDLRRPIFAKTSNYGHFGREGFTWEACDKVNQIKEEYKKLS